MSRRTTIFRRVRQPLEVMEIPRVTRQQKYQAIAVMILISLGLLLADLYLVFDTSRIQAKAEGELSHFFSAKVKVTGVNFRIFSQLSMEEVSLKKPRRFSLFLQGVSIHHHPLLAFFGNYTPVYTEIDHCQLFIHRPNFRPGEWLTKLTYVSQHLSRLKRLQINRLQLNLEQGDMFSSPHSYHFQNVTFQHNRENLTIKGSHYNLEHYTSQAASPTQENHLPWDTLDFKLTMNPKEKLFKFKLTGANIHLNPKTYLYLPVELERVVRQLKLKGIFNLELSYTYQPHKPAHYSMSIQSYNTSARWQDKELTKGELSLNLDNSKVHLKKFRILLDKYPISGKASITKNSQGVQFILEVGANKVRHQGDTIWQALFQTLPQELSSFSPQR